MTIIEGIRECSHKSWKRTMRGGWWPSFDGDPAPLETVLANHKKITQFDNLWESL